MSVCGDFGGVTAKGEPCRRKATEGLCPAHRENAAPGGRPTKYESRYGEQVYRLCLLGATDEQLAEFFGVHVDTIHEWASAHPQFSEARKRGKIGADVRVAESLFDRAMGAEWTEEQAIKLRRVWYENGKRHEDERVEIVEVVRRAAPDTTAQIFWLKNRQPEAWRDKQSHEHSAPGGGPVEIAVTRKVVKVPANRVAEHMNGANGDGRA